MGQCDPSTIDPCEIGTNSIIQAVYHGQIVKTSLGYSITGQDLAPSGNDDQVVLTNIPSNSYPMPTNVFPVFGAIGGRTQAVFVGSDSKIYAVGEQGLLLNASHTGGSWWGSTSLRLPSGITVCDISKWEGTAGSGNSTGNATGDREGFIAFSTFDGEMYIIGNGARNIQSQASNTAWTKIDLPEGILVIDFAVGYRTLLVQGVDGNLYVSGRNSYLGNGTTANLFRLTLLDEQPNISVNGISQIEAGFSSYLVLDGDGTIHVLGENSEGSLGVGHTNDVLTWSKVGSGCGAELNNVAYISTLSSTDYRSASSAILVDETIRSWGMNDNQSITSGADELKPCPIRPIGNNSSAVAVSNGGHITPYINIDIQICNIGHNKDGAFGDGNDENGDYGEYTCIEIPGRPEICGTNVADLELRKTVSDPNPSSDDTIVFTIKVTNRGPDPSTGSRVRDLLSSGFKYLEDDANGAYNNTTGLWTVSPLEVGESAYLNITVDVLSSGEYINYAQIVYDNEVDKDSTPGNGSRNEDDDATVEVPVIPCPFNATCKTLASIPLDDCGSPIPASYDAGNSEAEIDDIFDDLYTCGLVNIYHKDSIIIEDLCSSITRTYWLTDDGFEILSCARVFTFPPDIEAPVTSCPPDATLTCGDDLPVALSSVEGSDNCSPGSSFDVIAVSDENWPDDFCLTSNETVEREYTAIDDCDNTSTCIQTLTFEREYLFLPNVFSPSGIDNNKIWTIFKSSNLTITECRIFDRWGNLVYASKNEVPSWDGRVGPKGYEQGVYVYIINYLDSKDQEQILSGDITLIE